MRPHFRARASQKTGKIAEQLCEIALKRAGYRLVEKVEAPRTKTGIYLRTCSGDFRAVENGGRSVLVECKFRDRNLRKSDFRPHQIESLQDHHNAGGLSIVAHVTREGCRLIHWNEVFLILHIGETIFGRS